MFRVSGTLRLINRTTGKSGKDFIDLVIDVGGNYPQAIPVKLFGRDADAAGSLVVGDPIEVEGEVNGREYQGKFYASLVGRKMSQSARTGGGNHTEERAPAKTDDDQVPF